MADERNTGIYEIVNHVSGNRYIGSGVDLRRRQRSHFRLLNAGKHHSSRLQAAWEKHGPHAFEFRILEYCDIDGLILREQWHINGLNPKYNCSPTAGSVLGFRFSPESLAKIRGRKRSPESVAKTAAAHRGMKRSAETRAKIRAKAIGRKRSPESVELGAQKLRGVKLPPDRVRYLIGNKHAVGLKHSDEWKARNSLLHTGSKRPKSPEHRAKSSAALKGIKHSPERRAAQAAGQRGKKRGPYKLNRREQGHEASLFSTGDKII